MGVRVAVTGKSLVLRCVPCEVSSVSLYGTAICSIEITKAGNSTCVDLTTLFVVILEFVSAI